jgi:glutamyl-tRNA synthetase
MILFLYQLIEDNMVKTRFAPSPTGNLHIGGARTAIISWLIAHKLDGEFVLRIEDTDTVRSKPEYTDSILGSLAWLGIDYSNTPVYQTQRYDRYREVAQQLIDSGKAYRCYSTNDELTAQREAYKLQHGHDGWKYDRKWRNASQDDIRAQGDNPFTVRLKVPIDGTVSWKDLTSGAIEIPNTQLDDFIILRSDGSPTYNFCVVVDDSDMQISHVIRGQDHISNTPKQIHIYHALDKAVPVFGHIPLILNMDGSKQSKSSGATSVNHYRDLGIDEKALVNYLLLISCNDLSKEIFTKEEFVQMFDLNKLGHTPIKFDLDKLFWINQQYLKTMPDDDFIAQVQKSVNDINATNANSGNWLALKQGVVERSKTSNDFKDLIAPILNWDASKIKDEPIKSAMDNLLKLDVFDKTTIHDSLKNTATELGIKFGDLAKPLRNLVFPDSKLSLDDMLIFVGKDNIANALNVKPGVKFR